MLWVVNIGHIGIGGQAAAVLEMPIRNDGKVDPLARCKAAHTGYTHPSPLHRGHIRVPIEAGVKGMFPRPLHLGHCSMSSNCSARLAILEMHAEHVTSVESHAMGPGEGRKAQQ